MLNIEEDGTASGSPVFFCAIYALDEGTRYNNKQNEQYKDGAGGSPGAVSNWSGHEKTSFELVKCLDYNPNIWTPRVIGIDFYPENKTWALEKNGANRL